MLIEALNEQIRFGGDPSNIYQGGKGVLVRSPFDGFEHDDSKTVVPATFWVNDIFSPSQLYPGSGGGGGSIWCPNDGQTGWGPTGFDCPADPLTGERGPWNYAQVAYVVGSKMGELFTEFESIQDSDWGWGVFYASDANTVDKRCRYLDDYNGYDCPGYWEDWGQDPVQVDDKLGAGGYSWGNPFGGGGGGGAGCHFEPSGPGVDQTNGQDDFGNTLVQDQHCQCNYAFSLDWSKWVETWIYKGELLNGGKGPSWSMDLGMCWTNNPRDMIQIQNNLWWYRSSWNNQKIPVADYSAGSNEEDRKFWGWNEIPVERSKITNPANWDAVVIKLPASDDPEFDLDTLTNGAKVQLVKDLDEWVSNNYLELGQSGRPVVVVRETRDASGNYARQFFCQNWSHDKYALVRDGDRCYMTKPATALSV